MELVKHDRAHAAHGEPWAAWQHEADTGETISTCTATRCRKSAGGLDTEGLVALPDGTFWVSDEYGPFIVALRRQRQGDRAVRPLRDRGAPRRRSGPGQPACPRELKKRKPNKGMEGLTLTPDGQYLVGIMQSSLDKNGTLRDRSRAGAITRIVKVTLTDPADVARVPLLAAHQRRRQPRCQAVSEITALPDGTFIVDERDGKFEGTATARSGRRPTRTCGRIDLTHRHRRRPELAADRDTIRRRRGHLGRGRGLMVGGKTIEDIAAARSKQRRGRQPPATAGRPRHRVALPQLRRRWSTRSIRRACTSVTTRSKAWPSTRRTRTSSTSPTTRTSGSPTCRSAPTRPRPSGPRATTQRSSCPTTRRRTSARS